MDAWSGGARAGLDKRAESDRSALVEEEGTMATEMSTRSGVEGSQGQRGLSIDVGCGGAKKPGSMGLGIVPVDGVAHVLDITRDRFPAKKVP
jgi:hypothetical protein